VDGLTRLIRRVSRLQWFAETTFIGMSVIGNYTLSGRSITISSLGTILSQSFERIPIFPLEEKVLLALSLNCCCVLQSCSISSGLTATCASESLNAAAIRMLSLSRAVKEVIHENITPSGVFNHCTSSGLHYLQRCCAEALLLWTSDTNVTRLYGGCEGSAEGHLI
jgi:hypothetical protein